VDATAARVAEEAVAIARASGNYHAILGSLNTLARSRALQGRLREAADTYAEAERSAKGGWGPYALVNGAYYYFGLGAILYEQDALDEVERHLEQGLALVRGMLTIDADVAILGHMTRVRLCQARGDLTGAHAALDEFATMAHERGFAAPPRMRADAMRARLALAAGDLATAGRWETSAILTLADDPGYPLEEVQLILVRLQIARARAETSAQDTRAMTEQTLGSLGRLQSVAEAGERIGSVIEILLLRALALAAREEIAPALEALGRALALGEQGGYRRIFLDEGAPLAALLRRLLAQRPTTLPTAVGDYAALLLEGAATSRATAAPPPVTSTASVRGLAEPLSERELAVLRLMAAGQANPEIASQLFVATSTVKWYVNSLFGKLAVTSRTQAVARARALGLLID
jgi:ATP/maltotriose-dependent transcriptional regulator MalT